MSIQEQSTYIEERTRFMGVTSLMLDLIYLRADYVILKNTLSSITDAEMPIEVADCLRTIEQATEDSYQLIKDYALISEGIPSLEENTIDPNQVIEYCRSYRQGIKEIKTVLTSLTSDKKDLLFSDYVMKVFEIDSKIAFIPKDIYHEKVLPNLTERNPSYLLDRYRTQARRKFSYAANFRRANYKKVDHLSKVGDVQTNE